MDEVDFEIKKASMAKTDHERLEHLEKAAKLSADGSIEQVLESCFDFTAAMLSLLCKKEEDKYPKYVVEPIFRQARSLLRGQANELAKKLEELKKDRPISLDLFLRKYDEFGI